MVQPVDLERMDPAVEALEEKAQRVDRVAIGAIPVIGSVAVEFFNSIFETPLNKRRACTFAGPLRLATQTRAYHPRTATLDAIWSKTPITGFTLLAAVRFPLNNSVFHDSRARRS